MGNAVYTKKLIMDYLTQKGLNYRDDSDSSSQSLVLGWSLDNLNVQVHVILDDDGDSLQVGAMLPVKVPEGKLPAALMAVNEANRAYRWISFSLDLDDGTILGQVDAVVEPSTVGAETFELIMRTCNIVDDAYPKIMHAIY